MSDQKIITKINDKKVVKMEEKFKEKNQETKPTQAELFCKIADWLRRQESDFTKHFKGSHSIISVWNKLPKDYDKANEKVTDYISKNKGVHVAQELAMFINSEFGMRYFDDVPKQYSLHFGLNRYHSGGYEVHLSAYNNWAKFNEGSGITIKDLGNARSAYEKLLEEHKKYRGTDYDIVIGERLQEAFKQSPESKEELSVGIDVHI